MVNKKPIIVIVLLCMISINVIPIQSKSLNFEDKLIVDKIQSIDDENKFNLIQNSESSSGNWNSADNSSIENKFVINENLDDSTQNFTLDNCDDWTLDSDFSFNDIRSERITNGNAETSDDLWTNYLPPKYEGNVTRENNFPIGNVISGDYSWYFNLTTSDHAVIIGFDDPINVSSDSVIFSFSYSLLRNNLGTSYDSNICIRLFFQFDVYIFFWFNGDIGVLSNVTGPGGYADLLVNEASFDGSNHNYSLNVTALGLELFDQKPDQLRSLAVQTWGELSSYEMEYILDEISLTDEINPTSINLNVNSNPVFGGIGKGSVSFTESSQSIVNYNIDYSYENKVYFNYLYNIAGLNKSNSQRKCDFINWNSVRWNETIIEALILPSIANELTINKIIPVDWIITQIKVDEISQSYQEVSLNVTHKKIVLSINSYNRIEFSFNSNNLVNNLILSDYQITHNDNLTVSIESDIFNKHLKYYIIDSENEIYFLGQSLTNIQGDALLTNIYLDSKLPRNFHSIYVFWNSLDRVGIGKMEFEITSFPTYIVPRNSNIIANYKQNYQIEIDYINLEINDSIDMASVYYSWEFGTGILLQNIDKKYFAEIINDQANPGLYNLSLICSKNGYATSLTKIEIEIDFIDYNLTLIAPDTALPGEYVNFYSIVKNNFSLPVTNVKVRFEVNGAPISDTWTNNSGISEYTYAISPIYSLPKIDVKCSIIIADFSYLTQNKSIYITISETPQAAQLDSLTYNSNKYTNETSFFNYTINYPLFGKYWYASISASMNLINAKIISDKSIIQANIVDDYITWEREVNTTLIKNDILEIEILKPQITLSPEIQKNRLTVDIIIASNNLPYTNLKINITRDSSWETFDQWGLSLNGDSVTEKSNLIVTPDFVTFLLNTTTHNTIITYQLTGTKSNIIQISPTTVVLGIGTLVLTIFSSIILIKKKSKVSLDIQI